VSYSHAGFIDRPLVITKYGVSILPHQNWRGEFSSGTRPDGTRSDCPPGVTTGCVAVRWPGYRTTAWHHDVKEPDIRAWWGGLVDGMRDASGQQYKRNRYYDPATGQFTQPDPIGIAGGLNSYGFAAGDPVSYSDPYGLSAQQCPPDCTTLHKVSTFFGALAGGVVGGAGGAVAGTVILPIAGTAGGGTAGAFVGAGEGAVLGLATANVAEVGAELIGEGAADGARRVINKGRIIAGLIGQLIGMGEPLPNPKGPESDRPRVERPQKRPTVQPFGREGNDNTQRPPRRACAPVSGCAEPE
jgi:RHS repeat-associated protein